MKHLRYSIIFCITVGFLLPEEIQAQTRSLDTTVVSSSHAVKVKPKKIKKRRTIYKMQSQSVAEELGLSAEQTVKLEVLYREMRKSHKLALTKIPKEGDKEESVSKIQELKEQDQEKLAADLKSIMTVEQIERSLPLLCCFNPQWDSFTNVLVSMKLEKDKMRSAMALVNTYILSLRESKERSVASEINGTGRSGGKSRDRSSGKDLEMSRTKSERATSAHSRRSNRESPQMIKQHLDIAMGQLLTTEQYEVWMDSSKKGKQK